MPSWRRRRSRSVLVAVPVSGRGTSGPRIPLRTRSRRARSRGDPVVEQAARAVRTCPGARRGTADGGRPTSARVRTQERLVRRLGVASDHQDRASCSSVPGELHRPVRTGHDGQCLDRLDHRERELDGRPSRVAPPHGANRWSPALDETSHLRSTKRGWLGAGERDRQDLRRPRRDAGRPAAAPARRARAGRVRTPQVGSWTDNDADSVICQRPAHRPGHVGGRRRPREQLSARGRPALQFSPGGPSDGRSNSRRAAGVAGDDVVEGHVHRPRAGEDGGDPGRDGVHQIPVNRQPDANGLGGRGPPRGPRWQGRPTTP